MTPVRQHCPGEGYRDARDVAPGEKFLGGARDALAFAWAFNAARYGQEPSLLVASETAYESISFDTTGNRSEHWRQTHRETSRIIRIRNDLERGHHVFAHGEPCEVIFRDEDAEVRAILDLLELYPHPEQWIVSFEDWGTEQTVHRTAEMGAAYPETLRFTPKPPPFLRRHGVDKAKQIVRTAIAWQQLAREVGDEIAAAPVRPCHRPRISFDAGDATLIARAELEYQQFQEEHEYARRRFKRGRRDVVFPHGTVFWRRRVNVNVAGPPSAAITLHPV